MISMAMLKIDTNNGLRWMNIFLGPSPFPFAFHNAIKWEGVFSLPQCKTFLHSLLLSNTAAVGMGFGCGG